MKKNLLLFSALLVFSFVSCSSFTSGSDGDDSSSVSGDASETELAVITEMNYARTKPQEYVTNRLVPQRTSATVNVMETSTFQTALEECISEMNAMSAVGSLSFGSGLYKAARSWVETQGEGNSTGHDPNLYDRIQRYCTYTMAGENLAYGYSSAQDIVVALLVDDGVSDRGHRKNILNGSYTHAGAAIGSHAKYDVMCCIDYAAGYGEE